MRVQAESETEACEVCGLSPCECDEIEGDDLADDAEEEQPSRRQLKEAEEAARRKAYRRDRGIALAAANPADAPQALYEDYLRQARNFEDVGVTNEALLSLNTHCPDLDHNDGAKVATLARLISEGILTPATENSTSFAINSERLPTDTRDLYRTALDYLAHKHIAPTLSYHCVQYGAGIYRHRDREAILARLQAEGYIGSDYTVRRRPEGATVETYFYQGRFGQAEVVLSIEDGGFYARAGCSVHCGDTEGRGSWRAVYPPEHNYSTNPEATTWQTREAARSAAIIAVAREAEETAFDAGFHPTWRPQVPTEANKIRTWAEYLNGAPLPQQFTDKKRSEREEFLRSRGKDADPTSEAEDIGQLTLF